MQRIFQLIRTYLSNHLVIKGTLILTCTGILTRCIGFYNRIFLAGLIGAEQLGIYQLIFPIYMVAFSFSTFGNELALTKLVSEYRSRNEHKSCRLFFRICFVISLLFGILAALFLVFHAQWLARRILHAPAAADCLRIIGLGIPFMAMKGSIHGYFLGYENSAVHGTSDFLEQLTKVGGLYLLSVWICLPNGYPASFAVWGIVLGELLSFLYSVLLLILDRQRFSPRPHTASIGTGCAVRLFIKNTLPLTTNRLALTLLQSMEAILIPSVLLHYYKDSSVSLSMYGIFTGMAFPFIMFPSTITNSLSTMLLPAVSSANSGLHHASLRSLCEKSLAFCLQIGLFSMVVFYLYGPQIGVLFFQNELSGQFLLQMSVLCPFIYLATTLASILNGLGFASHNLFFTVLATGIRLGFILFTVPRIGLYGYILGMFFSYLFLTLACTLRLEKTITFRLSFLHTVFYPFVYDVLTGVVCYAAYMRYGKLLCSHSLLRLLLFIGIYGLLAWIPYVFQALKKDTQTGT